MEKDCFLVVNSKVLPSVYKNVLRAKTLLAEGKAPNASQAVKAVGISRSAFYKYKDYVFEYQSDSKNQTIHLNALLNDRAGVFSAMTAMLYRYGVNIITVNQSMPVNGMATVSLTISIGAIKISLDELLQELRTVDGIISVKSI